MTESFDHVQDWLHEVNRYASEGTCKLLIGNKDDRSDKVVNAEQGQKFSSDLGIEFLETSAKTAANVEAAFTAMAAQLIKNKEASGASSSTNTVDVGGLESSKSKKDKCGCA